MERHATQFRNRSLAISSDVVVPSPRAEFDVPTLILMSGNRLRVAGSAELSYDSSTARPEFDWYDDMALDGCLFFCKGMEGWCWQVLAVGA